MEILLSLVGSRRQSRTATEIAQDKFLCGERSPSRSVTVSDLRNLLPQALALFALPAIWACEFLKWRKNRRRDDAIEQDFRLLHHAPS